MLEKVVNRTRRREKSTLMELSGQEKNSLSVLARDADFRPAGVLYTVVEITRRG
jgi:tRNA (Thr-GGU) A37 N-methylase